LRVEDDVILHCDYSPVNVLIRNDGKLVVIDAAPNEYFTQRADLRGPRYVDLATYTARLYWPYRLRAYKLKWRKLIWRLRRDFIASYEKATDIPIDLAMLSIFERAVLRSRVEWKTKSALVRLPMIAIGNLMLPGD
jgi:thiamine kinase-like enzyme